MFIKMTDSGNLIVQAENVGESQDLLALVNAVRGPVAQPKVKEKKTKQNNWANKVKVACTVCGEEKKNVRLHMRHKHPEQFAAQQA